MSSNQKNPDKDDPPVKPADEGAKPASAVPERSAEKGKSTSSQQHKIRPSVADITPILDSYIAKRAYGLNDDVDYGQIARSIGTISAKDLTFARVLADLNLYGIETAQQRKVRQERDVLQKKLDEAIANTIEQKESKKETEKLLAEYEAKSRLGYLLTRLDPEVHERVLSDEEFVEKFADGEKPEAYVISIDIRRSTELMLKASTPSHFAAFMSTVSATLSGIMKKELCVVDKFTGDGMLGFFPHFYSGDDFGKRALDVAHKCHLAFSEIYRSHLPSFSTVLRDIGLGIGIDYGEVQLMRSTDGLTVIGRPVVYACRLSGAPSGKTYVNQSARNDLDERYPKQFRLEYRDFEIKNEGWVVVSEAIDHSIGAWWASTPA